MEKYNLKKKKMTQNTLQDFCHCIFFKKQNTWNSRWQKPSRARAFTLVETLVAISILMISVTGPLYYASESLKAAIYARDQITAFYLAQDAIEQIRKIRDDNIYWDGTNWYDGLTGCEDDQKPCRVAPSFSGLYTIDTTSNTPDYSLYIDSTNGIYSHTEYSDSKKTIFTRKIIIQPTDTTSTTDWTKATEMKVTVIIDWNSRGTERNFTAYEFLRGGEK